MKYVDEFRDPDHARQLVSEIHRCSSRRWSIMEVCGGQTHGLMRYGIVEELQSVVELLHGPGCPVCVTPAEDIDFARELAAREDVILASFGDMLRVPGTRRTLLDVRAAGGDVRVVYSPLDAVSLAVRHPERQVVFFAVGFETTAPATALAVLQARQLGLSNFSLLVSHVCVQPAMEAILRSPGIRVQGFLAAGHVCTITGHATYADFVRQFAVPVVVTGFEPTDLLEGILECVRQLESGRAEVSNCYARSVRAEGNLQAQEVVSQIYQVADVPWRGLGVIAGGGLRLREEFAALDSRRRFESPASLELYSQRGTICQVELSNFECPAAEVLSGRRKPTECSHFGTACRPERPLGALMVSSEGACAAYYRYRAIAGDCESGEQET